MDAGEYLSNIEEQLRAYDFEEREITEFNNSVFEKYDEGLIQNKAKTVVLKEVPDPTVEGIKESIELVEKTIIQNESAIFSEDASPFHFYAILVPSESTKAMDIAVKRAAKNPNDRSNWYFLPILVNLDDETLSYQDTSLMPHWEHRMMVRNIDDYFRV